MKICSLVGSMCLALSAAAFAQQTLTNDLVEKMAKAGLSDDIIIATVNSTAGQYATDPDDLVALKRAGVSDKVIAAMIAKTAPPASPPPVAKASSPQADSSGKYILREGQDVSLRFAEDLNSKTALEGDPVILDLDDDLKVGGVVVAKVGSKALGEVTNAEKSGMLGKAGQLNIRLDYLKVGDSKIMLRGTKGRQGQSGTAGVIVLTVLFGPIGLIKHGQNVEIKQSTPLHAFVADDIALPPAP